MCQPEVYWLSKQRILFFWDWQNLNIKRLFCKQWIATTWHYLPCKFTWNIPTNLLTLGQRTLRKLGELSSLFIFYNILYNITISLLYALISGHLGGVDPGDIQGNSAGFAGYCRQYLAQDGGIGPLLPFRGKIHGERPAGFVTSPPSWKWKIWTAGTGFVALYSKHRSMCMFVEIVILWCWTSLRAENRLTSYFCLLYILLLDFY